MIRFLPYRLAMLLVMLAVMLLHTGRVIAAEAEVQPLPRVVLALYDSREFSRPELTLLHRFAEMPLNHLGLTVIYADVRQPLPDIAQRQDVRGVLTWFRDQPDPLPDPVTYMNWAKNVIAHHKKFVVLGNPGFVYELGARPELYQPANELLKLLGLRYDSCEVSEIRYDRILNFLRIPHVNCGWVGHTSYSKFTIKNPEFVEFERKLEPMPPYNAYRQVDEKLVSYLTARQLGKPATDAILVSTNSNGGFADIEFAVHTFYDPKTDHDDRAWYINPFTFFAVAFATDDLPKPDTTTLAGRRIYYSHIDGDGWNNTSTAKGYENKLSSQVMFDRLLAPYNDLPVTVAVIAADIDPKWAANKQSREIAQEVFALPQVEPASHTYSHPFDWEFFKDYTPAKERGYLKRYAAGYAGWGALATPLASDPSADPNRMPRAFANEPFNLDKEMSGARDELLPLLPHGKTLQTLMLSGDTTPYEAVLRKAREAGMVAINGGDSRFDDDFPSYSWTAPIGRMAGKEIQVYASSCNDNTYTHGEQRPYDGYKQLLQSVEHTDHPIRIKPFNMYYHVFSSDHQASLDAVHDNLEAARKMELTPIEASRYAKIAHGFYNAQMIPLGKNRWRVEHRGELQTIRFDHGDTLGADFVHSVGVIGQMHYQGSLYLYLDESVASVIIALQPAAEAAQYYLHDSRWRVWHVAHEGAGVRFSTQGFGAGAMVWHVPQDGVYNFTANDASGHVLESGSVRASDQQVSFALKSPAMQPVTISLRKQ